MERATPWWWLDEPERIAAGLGPGARRSELGVVFGEGGGPHRVEVVAAEEDAPLTLGPVALRLWGPAGEAGDAVLGAVAALLASHPGAGAAFDPAAAAPLLAAPAAGRGAGVTLVTVPSTCDRACLFCGVSRTPPGRRRPRAGEAPAAAVQAAAGDVLLTGDDAAAHPEIVALVARAARRGRVSLIGPPRKRRERWLAPALASAGLARWTTGLFGADAAAHDAVAGRPGALAALLDAAAAYTRAGVEVELVTPLVVPVLGDLPGLVRRAAEITPRRLVLQAYVPDSDAGTAFDALVPSFEALRAALATLDPGAPVTADGLPPCVLPPALAGDAAPRLDRSDAALSPRHPAECEPCASRDRCPGIATTVLRAVGARGLAPL